MAMKEKTLTKTHEVHLIESDGEVYVSRPTSWLAGWARHIILERKLARKVSIASPELWASLEKTGRHFFVSWKD